MNYFASLVIFSDFFVGDAGRRGNKITGQRTENHLPYSTQDKSFGLGHSASSQLAMELRTYKQ